MRTSLFSSDRPMTLVISLIAMVTTGAPVLAEGLSSTGLIGELASTADLESSLAGDGTMQASAAQSSARQSSLRQAVPARDRVESYRNGEMFRNSRVALPLLVADLEAKTLTSARPMSGRSVGAPPASAVPQTSAGRVPSQIVPTLGVSRR